VATVRRLFEVILACPGRPREAALQVLLDWWGTFQPEPGYERFTDADGLTMELLPAIMEAARRARAAILLIVAEDPDTRKLVRQLLKCIDAGWDVVDR
jgi:hypothetical protein